ncbi:hypothetical protein [Streptomyces sp. NPDC005953]|uniref:hypothetical protein n=1 Tax=Streptomyces sp. NPDC005953 TaxID=3156719 RepID=UPI0033C7DA60
MASSELRARPHCGGATIGPTLPLCPPSWSAMKALYVIARNLMELFQLRLIDGEPLADFGFLDTGDVEEHSEAPHALWTGRKESDDRFRLWVSRFVELDDH